MNQNIKENTLLYEENVLMKVGSEMELWYLCYPQIPEVIETFYYLILKKNLSAMLSSHSVSFMVESVERTVNVSNTSCIII